MNTQPANLLLSFVVLAGYLFMCGAIWRRVVSKRRHNAHLATTQGEPATLLVAHASQTGTAESIAVQTADALQTAGVNVALRSLSKLDKATLQSTSEVLLIVSTYGEGDPPDAAAHFVASVMRDTALDLSRLKFGLLALGDRTYRNFCGFGRDLEVWLQQRGAQPLFARIDVDRSESQALQAWRRELGHIAATTDLPEWQDLPFESWILRARKQLNPGSLGAPVFHLELEPQGSAGNTWEAGDLLQVQVPSEPDKPRDYSIASIAADGAVHLLVRLQVREDGSVGGASGWLTGVLPVGSKLNARLRAHNQFRIGTNGSRDLILIGNGTGLAGLRAHLRQRDLEMAAGGPKRRHWLLFGERQAGVDRLYGEEIDHWTQSGLIDRLDLVYSRDEGEHRYVQDRLRSQTPRLREWIDCGAAIYVCGSLEGMAEGVATVLRDELGDELIAQLQLQGRYMRDVY